MWCLQNELAHFSAYSILLIPVFYSANQANPKMIKFSAGLVPLLTDTTVCATHNSSRNEKDIEKQDSMVASCFDLAKVTVSHSLGFSMQLFSKHLLKEPLLLRWPLSGATSECGGWPVLNSWLQFDNPFLGLVRFCFGLFFLYPYQPCYDFSTY